MSLRYVVRIDHPKAHTAEVELTVPATDAPHVDITMPAWCPGSYLIRDYARFVRDFWTSRPAKKIDKSTWRVDGGGELTVRYALYGNDLTVRTNHIDDTHAFLHGPATFVHPVGMRDVPVEVEINAPGGWDISTGAARNGRVVHADSIDELYDHPLHVGIARRYPVPAKVPVELVVWGDRAPGGPFDEQRLAADLAAIVDDHCGRFGEAPFERYVFVVMLTHDGYGGLEHRASSINLYHPHFAATRKAYEGLLELLSHEFFHAWNGKRIAPRPLLEFDYTREAYTPCLWVMEGITSHYDRFALRTSGRVNVKSFLDKVLDDWARLQATPGRARQSLEQSSFDAWIKLYKPDESNLNTTVSYYLKGGLAMLTLDLEIRRRSDGAKSLDDALRALWQRYGKPRQPHPDDLQGVFDEATNLSLQDTFDGVIRGVRDPDFGAELAHVGLELRGSADPAQIADGLHAVWIGATVSGTKVTGVFDGSPAQLAGLTPGDEIIAIDGFRTTGDGDIRNLAATRDAGDIVKLAVFRRHRLVEVPVALASAPATRWEIAGVADPGNAAARYQAWLGEPHPGAQVLATVTTTARWI